MNNLVQHARISGTIELHQKESIRDFIKDPSNEVISESELLRQLINFWVMNNKVIPSHAQLIDLTRVPEYRQKISSLESELNESNRRLTSLNESVGELEERYSAKNIEFEKMLVSVQEATKKVNELEKLLASERKLNKDQKDDFLALDSKHTKLMNAHTKVLEDNESIGESLKVQLNNVSSNISELKKVSDELESVKATNKTYHSKLAKSNFKITVLVIIAFISIVLALLVVSYPHFN